MVLTEDEETVQDTILVKLNNPGRTRLSDYCADDASVADTSLR